MKKVINDLLCYNEEVLSYSGLRGTAIDRFFLG